MFDIPDRQTLRAGDQKKIIAPRRLALIVGSSDYLKPDVPLPEIPTVFLHLVCWFPVAGVVYYFVGMETKGRSIARIDPGTGSCLMKMDFRGGWSWIR